MTATAPPQPQLEDDPAAVVVAYYAAINRHDYEEAWNLGGKNFSSSYEAFVAGFAETRHDTVTILEARGNVVRIFLVAEQTDGSVEAYQGTYTVAEGVLVDADIRATDAAAPSSQTPQPHAVCRDGTVSYSVHRQGTCSGHGGVARWLRP